MAYVKIYAKDLAELYNIPKKRIYYLIKKGQLNPYSLEDIIDKYNNPHKLNKKRRTKST